jgi:hypothetical protein
MGLPLVYSLPLKKRLAYTELVYIMDILHWAKLKMHYSDGIIKKID